LALLMELTNFELARVAAAVPATPNFKKSRRENFVFSIVFLDMRLLLLSILGLFEYENFPCW
jgi:hypothetical protein